MIKCINNILFYPLHSYITIFMDEFDQLFKRYSAQDKFTNTMIDIFF